MKNRKLIFINIVFWATICLSNVYAQTETHKIVYTTSLSAAQNPAKVGDKLIYPYHVQAGASIYLENKEGKIILINGPQTLIAKDVEDMFHHKVGLSKAYFSYVVSKMTKSKSDNQNSFGGVSRGQDYLSAISPIPGETIMNDTIQFVWRSKPFTTAYYFNLTDDEDNILLKLKLVDTTVTIYWEFLGLDPGQTIKWFVSELPFGTEPDNILYIPTSDSIERLESREATLLSLRDSSGYYLIELSDFYIQQKLFTKALESLTALSDFEEYGKLSDDMFAWLNSVIRKD